ncbi:type II and III secretion system protein family protein [Siccirubricoccus sp. KC 17139]|uniref:Type II and III secretion system protein family protein n=1 Tax=Siccirubricoccus soli TaxID=2899147 RepID=A0ABT1DDD3_9PROT|nr:type II and III secretion system protein family protein [Siccirubricoccus soli]MCO6419230.1 type II and III secretion system protein family protein [Siccirubricoccus soli]MCP2685365.1 type II and III secretion system protein family protein [Siccirubricoccus soli]
MVQAGPSFAQASGGGPRPGQAPGIPAPAAAQPPPAPISLTLEAGVGRLLHLPSAALTVMAADPRIARVQPASPTSLFLMAVAPGRTTVIATAEDGTPIAEYDVLVQPGRGTLAAQQGTGGEGAAGALQPLNPGVVESLIRRMVRGAEGVRVTAAGQSGLLLSGQAASAADAQRAEAIARAYAGDTREVINDISLLSSIQVNVRVRVAEISRQVTRELGFNWQALANDGANWAIGMRTGAAGRVLNAIAGPSPTTSGRYGVGFGSSRFDINAVIDALASDQLITVLAEPNLTAQSGEVASFLAGGEFPVPVAASSTSNAISIEFKQFGVSLAFVPTVLGPDRLNLRVRPEVSELSENGAISLPLATGVITIPALAVRRAETTVELGSGQSFAIAGLLQRSNTLVNSGIAGLGDVPVLGALFRSDRFRRNETELVIIVTPYLVRPVSDPRALAAPTDGFRPATDLDRILYRRQVARGAQGPQVRARLDAGFILE